jgi:hypothetical protein
MFSRHPSTFPPSHEQAAPLPTPTPSLCWFTLLCAYPWLCFHVCIVSFGCLCLQLLVGPWIVNKATHSRLCTRHCDRFRAKKVGLFFYLVAHPCASVFSVIAVVYLRVAHTPPPPTHTPSSNTPPTLHPFSLFSHFFLTFFSLFLTFFSTPSRNLGVLGRFKTLLARSKTG